MPDVQPPEGLLPPAELIQTVALAMCSAEKGISHGSVKPCQWCRNDAAAALTGLFEACEVREDFPMTYTTKVARLLRTVTYKDRETAVASVRSYATEGYLPAEVEHLWTFTYRQPVMRMYDDGEPVSSTGEESSDGD